MHRCLQFGMRENPASDRRHGSRHAVEVNSYGIEERNHTSPQTSAMDDRLFAGGGSGHAAPHHAATATGRREEDRLLTVQEVAALLQVPSSWVYTRTRKRSTEHLPGYRLGKYWRFRRIEIQAWIERQRGEFRGS